MKKYLLLLLLSAIPLTTYAGVLDFSRTTNYYGSGTQSPVLGATVLYPQAGGTGLSSATAGELNYCLKVSNNSPLTYAFGVCGSGAGGGAGTWSTTTSTVSGRLINYPNNTTDIVTVGGSATTTAKFYIDPNINQIFSTGILNIGNSVAPQSTAFGTNGGKYQLHYSTSTDDIAGWDLYNISTGTQAGIGIFFQNANSPLGGLGALQTYYGGILYSGKNWNGVPLGFGALPANSTGVLASDGAVVIGSATSTGVINFYAGSGSFNGSTMDMTIRNDGFVGIGTTTPYSKLSVAGQVVGQNFVATSTTAISTFASNVGIGTTTIFNPQAWGRLLQISNPSAVNGAGISLADQNTEWNMATYNSALRWSNGIATPSMILTNTNRLGIGTTTPGTTLSLGDTGANTSNISVTSTSTLATGINLKSGCYAVNGVCITGGTGGSSQWTTSGSDIYYSTGNVGIGTTTPFATFAINPTAGTASNAFVIGSSTDTLLKLDNSGNLTIGTTSGSVASLNAKLQIQAYDNSTSKYIVNMRNSSGTSLFNVRNDGVIATNGTITIGSGLSIQSSSGAAAITFATAGGSSGNINIITGSGAARDITLIPNAGASGVASPSANVGVATTSPYAKLSVAGANSASTTMAIIHTANGTAPVLYVATSTGSATTTALVIDGMGEVGIGTSSPWRSLSVQGGVAIQGLTVSNTGNAVCILSNFEVVNSGGTTCVTSSARFKTNIKDLNTGLSTVMMLRPREFTRKDPNPSQPSGKEIGFIAEEVNLVEPRLVEYETDGKTPRGVNYAEATALLTKAIQEQQAQIELLKEEIELLKIKK